MISCCLSLTQRVQFLFCYQSLVSSVRFQGTKLITASQRPCHLVTSVTTHPWLISPFRWSSSCFTYLGIRVSANIKELYKQNFTPTLAAVKSDLNRWFDLSLSWMGRISLIKMNVLPRILYPLQMLPLKITKKTNLDIERFLSNFIWHGKKPRLKMKTLQSPIDEGGQALPNFLYYNYACHARIISDWLKFFLLQETHVDAWCLSPLSAFF